MTEFNLLTPKDRFWTWGLTTFMDMEQIYVLRFLPRLFFFL